MYASKKMNEIKKYLNQNSKSQLTLQIKFLIDLKKLFPKKKCKNA